MTWDLTCKFCNHTDTSLVAMQEHLMEGHKVSLEDIRTVERTKTGTNPESYQFGKDATPYFDAVKKEQAWL